MFFHLVVVATKNLQFVVTVDDVVILDVPIAVVHSDFVAVVVGVGDRRWDLLGRWPCCYCWEVVGLPNGCSLRCLSVCYLGISLRS